MKIVIDESMKNKTAYVLTSAVAVGHAFVLSDLSHASILYYYRISISLRYLNIGTL
jgi:hypothetical protein